MPNIPGIDAILHRSKLKGVKVPTGKDAVDFKKLLFLPPNETELLLTSDQWNRIDLRCLHIMKKSVLQAACLARELPHMGGKKALVQVLISSFEDQREEELEIRRIEDEDNERYKNSLGGVWSFGTGAQGQLGHGDSNSCPEPTQIKRLRGFGVCKGCDSDVSFALTKTDEVYVWGARHGPNGLPLSGISLHKMYRQTLEKAESITHDYMAQGKEEGQKLDTPRQKHSDDSSDSEDDMFEEDEEEEEDPDADIVHPVLLHSLSGEELTSMAIGRVHGVGMTAGGDVFTWGHNEHSQLGHEAVHNLTADQAKKAKVSYGADTVIPALWERTIPAEMTVIQVEASTSHTMVLTHEHQVMSFGAQFKTSDHSSLARSLRSFSVSQVSCGALHAALLTTGGEMYTWGVGDGGRLGHGDNASHVTPTHVKAFKNDIVSYISCGYWHTAAIVLVPPLIKGGFVYTWGSGRQGQLGRGELQVSLSPGLVEDLLSTYVIIKSIDAGMTHNVALSVDNDVYTWGSNVNGCLGRPMELGEYPEDFCAVPGQVEGLTHFIGKPCSVAAGRDYTLIATRPYSGQSKRVLDARKAAADAEAAALARAEELERRRLAKLQTAMDAEKVALALGKMNQAHPMCSQCTDMKICPGFQKDVSRPKTCKNCLHDLRRHDVMRMPSDDQFTIDITLDLLERLDFHVDFNGIHEKYPDLQDVEL